MAEVTFKEKRLFQRYLCSLEGDYISSHDYSDKVKCQDISALGIGLVTSRPLSISALLKMNIITKKGIPLSLEGRVCWVKERERYWRAGVVLDKPLFLPLKMII